MAWWRSVCLLPLVLAACGPSKQERSARLLDHRLRVTLASDIASGGASVQRVPGGVRVTLLTPGPMPAEVDALNKRDYDPRASVIESMLDPRMMRLQVADSSALLSDQQAERVQGTEAYFTAFDLGDVLEAPTTPAGGPAGLTMTIHIVCPRWHNGTGYDNGTSKPVCE